MGIYREMVVVVAVGLPVFDVFAVAISAADYAFGLARNLSCFQPNTYHLSAFVFLDSKRIKKE